MKRVSAIVLSIIFLLSLSGCKVQEEKWAMIPAVMVNDVLYVTTGHSNPNIHEDGLMDGYITSVTDSTELPTKNDQANFESADGCGYQYGTNGTIEVNINGMWWIYATEETKESCVFFMGNAVEKSLLSEDTLEWLNKHNSLGEGDQIMTSFVPQDLLDAIGVNLYGEEIADTYVFNAKIIEISDKSYLVEPVEGSSELKSADRIWVPIKNSHPSPEPVVGDIIQITYDGMIAESYPAEINGVYEISIAE